MQDLKYTVYWIHYPYHTDPCTEGYVGITNDVSRRLVEHNSTNPHMKNRISKGAVCDILIGGVDREAALNLESELRPTENIGWNVAPGGSIPPPRKGKKNKIIRRGDDCTPKQKRAHIKHSQRMKGRLPTNAVDTYLFGNKFPSISEACRYNNITYEQYLYWLEHQHIKSVNELKEVITTNKNTSISQSRISSSKVKRGVYYITGPDGESYVISSGIIEWCHNRGLNASNLRRLGKSKGYVCVYQSDNQK